MASYLDYLMRAEELGKMNQERLTRWGEQVDDFMQWCSMQFLEGRSIKTPSLFLITDYFRAMRGGRSVKTGFYMVPLPFADMEDFSCSFYGDLREDVMEHEADWVWEKLVDGMVGRDRIILELKYQEELSMKEIGRLLQISEARVSQLHKKILARLRKAV